MRMVSLLAAMLVSTGALAAPPHTLTLKVQNMSCGTCPVVVRKALEQVPGVRSAKVDFDNKTATVSFDPDRVKPDALTQATTNAGFPSAVMATP
jgi:mercuric ion binding protein